MDVGLEVYDRLPASVCFSRTHRQRSGCNNERDRTAFRAHRQGAHSDVAGRSAEGVQEPEHVRIGGRFAELRTLRASCLRAQRANVQDAERQNVASHLEGFPGAGTRIRLAITSGYWSSTVKVISGMRILRAGIESTRSGARAYLFHACTMAGRRAIAAGCSACARSSRVVARALPTTSSRARTS